MRDRRAVGAMLELKKRWLRTYFRIIFPSVVVLAVAFLASLALLSYRVLWPTPLPEEGTPDVFLMPYREMTIPGGGSVWFIPGRKGAPSVFLCHDYGSNRIVLLNLAGLLHQKGYNLFLPLFRGHGTTRRGSSTLGLKEAAALTAAVDHVLGRTDVNPERIGLWGVGMGAYVSLRAALSSPRVRVVVLDSPYASVNDYLSYQVRRQLGFDSWVMRNMTGLGYCAYAQVTPGAIREKLNPGRLRASSTLYIVGRGIAPFERWTRDLYDRTPGEKELLILNRTRRLVLGSNELKTYDAQIVNYLVRRLPL